MMRKSQAWATAIPAPQTTPFNAATVTWTDASGDQKRGYDYTDGTWKSGIDTKVMAYFVFAPLSPRTGTAVWFTDASIAATSWVYDFFNEGDSIPQRSFYYRFRRPGQSRVDQQATGPAGSETYTQIVPVTASGSPGSILLLLGD